MKNILLIVCMLWSVSGTAQTTALFLGNSYTASNNLPALTADFAAGAGYELEVASNTPGGYTFSGHSTNATSQSLIGQGGWDFVVLQEQSQLPSFPLEQVEAECFPYATTLDEQVLAANPCAETVFFMTWGRENGDDQNCAFWPPVCTYEGMDDLLYERYMQMAADNDAVVSPVGRVWRYLRENNPEIELYSGDGSHPGAAGSYAAACCFFTVFFREDPTLSTFDYTLDATTAAIIREATRTVVYDELSTWFVGTYDVVADFSWTISGLDVSFTSLSGNADYTSWSTGFATSSETDPTFTFPSAGVYDVTLIAFNGCDADTLTQVIDLQSVGIEETGDPIRAWPVPSQGVLHLSAATDPEAWILTDLSGRNHGSWPGWQRVIDLSNFPQGIYFLHAGERVIRVHVMQ